MVSPLSRRLSLVTGTFAFAVLFPNLALVGMPSSGVQQGAVLAAQPAASSTVEQLNLSNEQKQKLRNIHRSRNQEISKGLNATQRTKLVKALRSGTKLGAALQTLNLSADQKQKIGSIVQQSNQQVKATLTPKQQQQLDTMRRQHQTTAQTPIE